MSRNVEPCIDWAVQRHDFMPDGSLRDIYVQGTSAEDWGKVLRWIERSPFQPRFFDEGAARPIPRDIDALFAETLSRAARLSLSVGGVLLVCHFFQVEEIESLPDLPFFRYDPARPQMEWLAPERAGC